MPRGDKSAYTDKQKRQAQHIEEGYIDRGVPEDKAEARAWATVNKMTGGGKKSGSGRGKRSTRRLPAKVAGQGAQPPHRAPQPSAVPRPRRPHRPAPAMRQTGRPARLPERHRLLGRPNLEA
jgi:hypothetical protein